MVAETLNEHRCRRMGKYIEKYGIYQPDTPTLRGTVTDNTQVVPIGLNGGRMADALQEILKSVDGEMRFGTLYYRRYMERREVPQPPGQLSGNLLKLCGCEGNILWKCKG